MTVFDTIALHGERLWQEALGIWLSGGWAMWAIAATAFALFGVGMHVLFALRERGFLSVPERTWRRWIDAPEERGGPIGSIVEFVSGATSIEETATFFDQVRMIETEPFERDLRVMRTCVAAAPLFGLLGTVTGMLATFSALGSGGGGDETMRRVASGISEALITTETGLVVALPGLLFQYHLSRGHERYKAFLAHLETVCTQALYHEIDEHAQRSEQRLARRELARHRRARRRVQTSVRSAARERIVGALQAVANGVGGSAPAVRAGCVRDGQLEDVRR